jgi:flagellar L-ring protein precursor FlgH
MKKALITTVALGALLFSGTGAGADSLYVAPAAPSAPGHPLSLSSDKKASQIGDLVNIVFNFNISSSSSISSQLAKNATIAIGQGTGNLAQAFLRFPTGISMNNAYQNTNVQSGANTFTASLMATVTDIMPSGALQIEGDQDFVINGQSQKLHVIGYVRTYDIDNTDSVVSTRVANVKGYFTGNYQEPNVGLLRKVLNFLF